MIDYHKELVVALSQVLPTHYELRLTRGTATPCISYIELSNVDDTTGETLGYSRISYQVKVWGNDIKVVQEYALQVDKALRPLGFRRRNAVELYDTKSTMIQKIMTYEALALEDY